MFHTWRDDISIYVGGLSNWVFGGLKYHKKKIWLICPVQVVIIMLSWLIPLMSTYKNVLHNDVLYLLLQAPITTRNRLIITIFKGLPCVKIYNFILVLNKNIILVKHNNVFWLLENADTIE